MDRVFASEANYGSSNLLKPTPYFPMRLTTTLNSTIIINDKIDTPLICRSQKHPFHILDASPYPFLVSFFLLTLLVPTTFYMHGLDLPYGLPRADFMHASFLGLYTTAMS